MNAAPVIPPRSSRIIQRFLIHESIAKNISMHATIKNNTNRGKGMNHEMYH